MSAAIFISFASEDRKTAELICSALESRGLSSWIYTRDIAAGENFAEAIVKAIRSAKVMVLIFSSNANDSDEIKKELVQASRNKLVVIPVRVEDVVPSDAFDYELGIRQWIDLFENWEQAIQRLVDQSARITGVTLRPEAEITPAPKPLLLPPRETKQRERPALARVVVVGVGGAGGNIINSMVRSTFLGCEFIACNADAESLKSSVAPRKIQLGIALTGGRGVGSRSDLGRAAAEEAREVLNEELRDSSIVFVVAGMGGGVGTGASSNRRSCP